MNTIFWIKKQWNFDSKIKLVYWDTWELISEWKYVEDEKWSRVEFDNPVDVLCGRKISIEKLCKHRYKILSTDPIFEFDRKCDLCWEVNLNSFAAYIEDWYAYITEPWKIDKNKINENWYFLSK